MNFKDPLVLAEDKTSEKKAHKLATELGLFFEGNLKNLREKFKDLKSLKTTQYYLVLSKEYIYLRKGLNNTNKPIYSNFLQWNKELKKTNLLRCMKGVPKDSVVIDATAGLGQDSCALATLTDKLIILDKVPWIHALLQDGLIKAKKQISQFDRVYPVCSDSKCYLSMLKEKPDVIYLDPMFNRKNSSKAKREIQALRDLVDDEEIGDLLSISLRTAKNRVIVKRHKNSSYLDRLKPTFSLKGKVIRYDVYSLKLR